MNRRTTVAMVAVGLSVLAPPAGADHSTPTGVDCSAFTYQEDAQAYFDDHPGDPEGLDGPAGSATSGVPGVACETLPHRPATTTTLGTTTTVGTTPPTTTTTTTGAVPTMPAAILSGASGQVAGGLTSSCWPEVGGFVGCRIVDYTEPGPDPAVSLAVTQGEVVTLRYEPALPLVNLRVGVWPGGPNNPALAAPVAIPSRFAVNLAPGRHVLSVDATFHGVPEGRLGHLFEVVVTSKAPVQPTRGRTLALTG